MTVTVKIGYGRRVMVMIGKRDDAFYGYKALAMCRSIAKLGGTAIHTPTPHVSVIQRELPAADILAIIKAQAITDVITVNIPPALAIPQAHTKADAQHFGQEVLPDGFQWHTLVEDPYDAHTHLDKRPFETRWQWCPRWGSPVLRPCTDYGRFLADTDGYDFDVSFVGYLPAQALSFASTDPRFTIRANIVYEEMLRLWEKDGADVNLHVDADHVEWTIRRAEQGSDTYIPDSCREAFAHFVAEAGVRFFQRTTVMAKVIDICKRRKWKLGIAGLGWNRLEEFAPYCIGHQVSGEMMAHLALRSKVNLHMGVETLFHNRPLEIFACGAFCLSWCPGDTEDEGLGLPLFTMDSIEQSLSDWIGNEYDRRAEVAKIGEIVRRDHTFDVRMEQLLKGDRA